MAVLQATKSTEISFIARDAVVLEADLSKGKVINI